MARHLTKIERLMRDRPEMFDYADIPPDRIIIPEQEAWYAARHEAWKKAVFTNWPRAPMMLRLAVILLRMATTKLICRV